MASKAGCESPTWPMALRTYPLRVRHQGVSEPMWRSWASCSLSHVQGQLGPCSYLSIPVEGQAEETCRCRGKNTLWFVTQRQETESGFCLHLIFLFKMFKLKHIHVCIHKEDERERESLLICYPCIHSLTDPNRQG